MIAPHPAVEAVQSILWAVHAYLPPDGISRDAFIERVLDAVEDPAVAAALGKPAACQAEARGPIHETERSAS